MQGQEPHAQPRTISIEPTPDGYRRIKQQFEASIQTYQRQLQCLDALENAVQGTDFGELTGEVQTLVEEMVSLKRASIEESQVSLQVGIAELERCGY